MWTFQDEFALQEENVVIIFSPPCRWLGEIFQSTNLFWSFTENHIVV